MRQSCGEERPPGAFQAAACLCRVCHLDRLANEDAQVGWSSFVTGHLSLVGDKDAQVSARNLVMLVRHVTSAMKVLRFARAISGCQRCTSQMMTKVLKMVAHLWWQPVLVAVFD